MRAYRFFLVLSGLLLLGVSVPAQTDAGNGVARVSFLRGDVTIQRGDSGDLTEAAINAPLVSGDRILTGPGSRAEVQFDYGHFARMAPNAEVRMQELRPERYLIAVAEGTVSFSRVDDAESEVEINTPSISVRPARRGNYRISVLPDGTTEITVRDGQAEIFSPNGVQRLGENRTMLVRGEAANPEFQTVAELRGDEFDEWNRDRDRMIRRSESYQYVDRSIPGAHELDAYGGWVNVAPYGHVWRPRVAAGWAPYRAGRWAWVDYYGWNWVSYDPWGWAPYHYGRWFNSPGVGWCWWPGGRMRHFYSPAVVGFVGFNIGNVGVGFGFGNVGWVPLAPYEPFHRWWGGGWNGWYRGGFRNNRTFVDNSVNIVNNVNITNVYRNARVNNGVTVVDGESFRRGASVNPVRVGNETLRSGNLVRGQLPVTPGRGSLQYTNRAVERGQMATRLERTEGRQFYSRTTPTRADRPNFEAQRGAMEQVQQRAFGRGESVNGGNSRAGSVVRGESGAGDVGRGETAGRGGSVGRGGTPAAERSTTGVSRGESARGGTETGRNVETGRGTATSPQRGSAVAQESDRGGWRRFGEPMNRDTSRSANTGRGSAVESGRANSETGSSARGETTRGSSSENTGWRRFGEPASRGSADAGRGADASRSNDSAARGSRGTADTGRSQSDGGWRSFGRGGSTQDSGSSRNSGATNSRGSSRAETGSVTRGSSASGSSDAFSRGSRSQDSGSSRGSSSSGQERVRVSPSIVRERGDTGRSGSGAARSPDRGGGSSGSGSSRSGSGRGATSGRGDSSNRSSVDGSSWRRFEGGAASGFEAYGEPARRSSSRASVSTGRSSSSTDAFRGNSAANSSRSEPYRGSRSSRTQDAYSRAGSAASSSTQGYGSYSSPSRSRSQSGAYSAPSSSGRGSYSSPSRSVYSGGSRSSAPSYSAPSRSSGSSRGYSGGSSRGSVGGSISRGGGGASRSSGGSVSRGGGGVSRSSGGGARGGRN
ncbi:MAG: DUF6600 domain-containing protein [Bryobacterales bacterium]|nr:DUF6600 domain-containing protein [Bryobacterales bacterium]